MINFFNVFVALMSDKRERFFSRNTMAVLLIAMTGRKVIIETKNESSITGKLLEADGYGNLWLSNSKLTTVSGKKSYFDELHVKVSVYRVGRKK